MLWAIAGWQRLRDRGHFVQPDAGKGMIGELADLASPIGAFVRECCKVGPGCQIERSTLFDAWKSGANGKAENIPAIPPRSAEICGPWFLPLATHNHEPTPANEFGFTKGFA